jgi:hypothetical protein
MAGPCSGELSTLAPTINTCPADTDLLLFVNVSGQPGGYAFRPWSKVRQCLLAQTLTFGYVQIPVPSAQLGIGGTIIRVNQLNVLQDSVMVVLDGVALDRNDGTRVSYTVSYDSTGFTVTLNIGANNLQTYVLTYGHS